MLGTENANTSTPHVGQSMPDSSRRSTRSAATQPLSHSNSRLNADTPDDWDQAYNSAGSKIHPSSQKRRNTIDPVEFIELIKAVASPAAPNVTESRQLIVDASALDGTMQLIAESVTPWQPNAKPNIRSNTRGEADLGGMHLDAPRVMELLQEAATPVDFKDKSVHETRTIDSANLQNVYDTLIPLLPPGAAGAADTVVSMASKQSARKGLEGYMYTSSAPTDAADMGGEKDALADDQNQYANHDAMTDDAVALSEEDEATTKDSDESNRRLTCDASIFQDLVLAAASPADESVPEERRVVVDRRAMESMRKAVVTAATAAAQGELRNHDEVIGATALSTGNVDMISESMVAPNDEIGSAKMNDRRGTIDPESLMDMIKRTMTSPAVASAAMTTSAGLADSSSKKRGATSARRNTIDPSQFDELLAQIASATKPEATIDEVGASPAQEEAKTPRDLSNKRRDTIDGADFNALLQRTIGTPFSASTSSARQSSSKKKRRSSRGGANNVSVLTAGVDKSIAQTSVELNQGESLLVVDADAMLNLVMHVQHAASPPGTPVPTQLEGSPYVSPPVSARTRSAQKNQAGSSSKKARRRAPSSNAQVSMVENSKVRVATLQNAAHEPLSSNVRRDSLQGDLSCLARVNTSAKQQIRPTPSRKSITAVGTVADLLSLAQDDVNVGIDFPTAANAARLDGHQHLKSCISTKKAGKGASQETPRKAVVFGAPAAAEFRRSDPSSTLTPMHREKAQAWFPINQQSGPDGGTLSDDGEDGLGRPCSSDSVTKVNSRILAAWGDSNNIEVGNGLNSMDPPGSRGSRRSSGRFQPKPGSALLHSNSDDDSDDTANSSGKAPMSVDSTLASLGGRGSNGDAMDESMASSASNKLFQSRMNSAASPGEASVATTMDGSVVAEDSQTEELEVNLGAMMSHACFRSVKGRESTEFNGEDKTVELEPGLIDLLQSREKDESEGSRAPQQTDDETVELEHGLADLLAGNMSRASARDVDQISLLDDSRASTERSKPRLSFSQDGTVELEGALSDLIAECGAQEHAASPRPSPTSAHPLLQQSLQCAMGSPAPRRSLAPFQPPRAPSTAASRNNSSSQISVASADECEREIADASGDADSIFASGSNAGLDLNASNRSLKDESLAGVSALLDDSSATEVEGSELESEEKEPCAEHLSEFKELLNGLGLSDAATEIGKPALHMRAPFSLSAKTGSFPYAVQVELEAIEESCVVLANDISPEAANEMARRLWEHAKSVRSSNADTSVSSVSSNGESGPQTHVLEMLLRALRQCQCVGGDHAESDADSTVSAQLWAKATTEDRHLVETAADMAAQIKAAAMQEWALYELDLVVTLEHRLVEAATAVSADGKELFAARSLLEGLDDQCDDALALWAAAKDNAAARDAAGSADEEATAALAEVLALEEELSAAKEGVERQRNRAGALEMVREDAQNLSSLRAEKVALRNSADVALERYGINAALRSWTPRTLSAEQGAIVVELPLVQQLSSRGDQLLRITIDCNGRIASALQPLGHGDDAVHQIRWEIVQKANGNTGEQRSAKRPRIPLLNRRGGGSDIRRHHSAAEELQAKLVGDWMGKEVHRLDKQPLSSVPQTLNRLDALVGRLRLAVAEVQAIEDLGLELSVFETYSMAEDEERDEEMGERVRAESGSKELWLHVPVSSVRHHCQVRLEVRIVDGYPWAPAELRLVPLLGSIPPVLRNQVQSLSTKMVQYGTPIVAGWNAVSTAVKDACGLL